MSSSPVVVVLVRIFLVLLLKLAPPRRKSSELIFFLILISSKWIPVKKPNLSISWFWEIFCKVVSNEKIKFLSFEIGSKIFAPIPIFSMFNF